MFGHLYLLTSYYYFISLYFYFIQTLFIFNIVSISILYGERICIVYFVYLQAISLAKLSRSSSSLDRLTSDRTNTKTDRL